MTYPPEQTPPGWQPPSPPQPSQFPQAAPPSWPQTLEQPLPAREPVTDSFSAAPGGRTGRLTLVLAALALLAVGVLTGLVLRGSFGSHANAATGSSARAGAGNGATPGGGNGYGQGRAFPGAGNGTQGTISSMTSDGFVMTTSTGNSVTVTVGPNTTVQISVTGTTSGALAVGQPVLVVGTQSQGTIAATAVREGTVARFGGGGGRAGGQGGAGGSPGGAGGSPGGGTA